MQIAQARYADRLEARRIARRWQLVAHFPARGAVIVRNARGEERTWASLDTLVRDLGRAECGQELCIHLADYRQETML